MDRNTNKVQRVGDRYGVRAAPSGQGWHICERVVRECPEWSHGLWIEWPGLYSTREAAVEELARFTRTA